MPDDIIQVSCFIIYMDKVMIYDKQNISTKNGTHWYPSFVKRKVFLQTVMTQETQNLNFLIDAPTFVNQLYF